MAHLPPSIQPPASSCTSISAYNDLETIKYIFTLTFDKFNVRSYEAYETNDYEVKAKSLPRFRFELCLGSVHVNLYIKFLSFKNRFIFHYKVGATDHKGRRCEIDDMQGCRSITEVYVNKSVQLFQFDKSFKFENGQSVASAKQITFHCELTFETEYNLDRITHISIETNEIRQLSTDFTELFKTGRHADLIFNIAGQEIAAHRAILAARSPVFSAMFSHESVESQTNRVDIVDIELEIFEQMLRFIYSGRVPRLVDYGQVLALLAVADKYELLSLKSICEEWLCAQLTTDTVHSLIVVADLHSASKLKAEAMEFFKRNTHQAIESMFANSRTDALLEAFRNLALCNAK